MRQAITIAGFDPSGGAGVLADVKTMHAHGVYAAAVITAITVQNTREVSDAVELPPSLVCAQAQALFDDFDIAAVKTGMLSSGEMVEAISDLLQTRAAQIPIVVDPVMRSESGFPLLEDGVGTLRTRLLPHARVVTPNLPEAQELAGGTIRSLDDMRAAAERIAGLGASAVVIKGGHAAFAPAVDVLFENGETRVFEPKSPVEKMKNVHGTGCTFASAIAALLAEGRSVREAVQSAKRYVEAVIASAPDIGGGDPPGEHFHYTSPWTT